MAFQSIDQSSLPSAATVIGDEQPQGGGAKYAHVYPATGDVTGEFYLSDASNVGKAVAAAQAAFPEWRAMTGDKRRDLMFKLAALIEKRANEMTPLLTYENGSILLAGPHMSADAAQKFRYFGGWADKIEGRAIDTWGGPAHDYVRYEPYGVVGAIVPWNGPLFAATMILAPALAAGNCVVLKAPENAPYSLMKLIEIIRNAGFPPGVVNLVTGGPDVGEAMVGHPDIGKIEFIGSGGTARKILVKAAETLKPVGLELGGKSAVLVFADADLQAAAKRGLAGAVSANGQGCVNGTRLLVERSIYEPYLQMLQAMAGYVKVGDPLAQDTVMGPVISDAALTRIQSMVESGVLDGGRVVVGGKRMGGDHEGGYFLPITVLADVSPESHIAKNEVFGPVLVVTPFDSEEEAITLANDTDYGLGAYIHTTNLSRAHRVANRMMAGQVQVNGSGEAMTPCVPFGGMKHSGHGRLGGIEGLREFQQVRNVWINLQD
jgi:acyl-CoA reductase-like NAD-dependent aldehyde dehydrogenase